jgi:P27 family predicted phage terminase small subunit
MARGRRAESPVEQRAKGSPGRRKSVVAQREKELQRIAALLSADGAQSNDPLAVPALIDQHSAPAVAIWKELAPRLARTHRLQAQHRPLFATFCVYLSEWVTAAEDVRINGSIQTVKTVSGDAMERIRPIVIIRDRAQDMVLKLSERFGLTPSDEYALFKDQSLAAATNPGLFDAQQAQSAHAPKPDQHPDAAPGIGWMNQLDSAPPTAVN